MSVSRSLRFQILRRDGHTCRYCGASAPEVKLTVDHVVPEALGGTNEASNLVTACDPCNGGKSATPPDAAHVAQVADDARRWADAMLLAADAMLEDLGKRNAHRAEFDQAWIAWQYGPADNHRVSLRVWKRRVARLLRQSRPARCSHCNPRGNPRPAPTFAVGYRRKTRGRNRR